MRNSDLADEENIEDEEEYEDLFEDWQAVDPKDVKRLRTIPAASEGEQEGTTAPQADLTSPQAASSNHGNPVNPAQFVYRKWDILRFARGRRETRKFRSRSSFKDNVRNAFITDTPPPLYNELAAVCHEALPRTSHRLRSVER